MKVLAQRGSGGAAGRRQDTLNPRGGLKEKPVPRRERRLNPALNLAKPIHPYPYTIRYPRTPAGLSIENLHTAGKPRVLRKLCNFTSRYDIIELNWIKFDGV